MQLIIKKGVNDLQSGVEYDVIEPIPEMSEVKLFGPAFPAPPAILKFPGKVLHCQGDNLTIRGCDLRGGGLKLDKPSGRNENIILDNNIWNTEQNSIEFTSGLKNSKIVNNRFEGNNGFSIYGYNYNNLLIANNECWKNGFHIDCQGGGDKLICEQNFFSGLAAMGCEFQTTGAGTVTGNIIQDNWFENPDVAHAGNNSMAFSLPLDKATGTIIRRNYVRSPHPNGPNGQYTRIMFELGGFQFQCYDNDSEGGNDVCAVNGSHATGTVHNNHFDHYTKMSGNNAANSANATFSNNGPTVVTTWQGRGRPHRNKRFEEITVPPTTPPPVTTPPSQSAPVIVFPPPSKTSCVPGEIIQAIGTGTNLKWEIDVVKDGLPEIKLGLGDRISFQVPTNVEPDMNVIRIRLIGSFGTVDKVLTIEKVVPSEPIDFVTLHYKNGTSQDVR